MEHFADYGCQVNGPVTPGHIPIPVLKDLGCGARSKAKHVRTGRANLYLRWFGHVVRMKRTSLLKVYMSKEMTNQLIN